MLTCVLFRLLNFPKQINLKPEGEDDSNSVVSKIKNQIISFSLVVCVCFLWLIILDGRFSSGLELANFVVSLDVLHYAWTAIWNLYTEISQNEGPSSLVKFKVFEIPCCTIIAFFTWPANSKDYVQGNGGGDFVSTSTPKKCFPVFNFLCTKDNQEFSINKPALELFTSIFDVLPESVVPL